MTTTAEPRTTQKQVVFYTACGHTRILWCSYPIRKSRRVSHALCSICQKKSRRIKYDRPQYWNPTPAELESEKRHIREANESTLTKAPLDDAELIAHHFHRTGMTHGWVR